MAGNASAAVKLLIDKHLCVKAHLRLDTFLRVCYGSGMVGLALRPSRAATPGSLPLGAHCPAGAMVAVARAPY